MIALGLFGAFISAGRGVAQELPTVVILSTGGTIASMYDSVQGGFAPALTGDDLIRAVPGLDTIAHIEVVQVANVASTNMTPALWLEVSRQAQSAFRRAEVVGAVVTHGTDTLEETAFFLDLTIASDNPWSWSVPRERPRSRTRTDRKISVTQF